jgi:pyruvate dehydrogenase E2 component (dihydrolipoamide acetyltransferase)
MAVTKVVLAKLSPTMEEGTIVKWNKKEGDVIKVGDVLAEIETDKANMEMESQGAGVLRKILVEAGGKAPIGTLIGVIADPKDDIAPTIAKAGGAPKPAAPAPAAAAPAPQAAAAPAAAAPAPAPAPAAPQPAPAHAAAPPAPAAGEGGRLKASPLARSMAASQNIDLKSLSGSGPGGRIVKRDVEAWRPGAAAARAEAPAARPAAPSVAAGQQLPISGMRKTIARRLTESKVTAPHFYVTVEINMDAAVQFREQLKAQEIKVSFNDLILKACAKALTQFPMVNSSWTGETINTHGEVHIGVAVAIPDGLIVPVVRNADQKSILEVSREVKELAARARDKKLKPEEFMGSTFSISNLGMYDVTEFTAIINPPESCILAVGAVRRVPVVKGDEVVPGHVMNVTLSSDHRVVDGALAAQFLGEVRRLLEAPITILL